MDCQQCQELFSLYVDEELDPQHTSFLESHLAHCNRCRMEWEAFRFTVEYLHTLPREAVPPGFLVGIHSKLEDPSLLAKLQNWLTWGNRHKVAASSAFALLVAGVTAASLMQLSPGPAPELAPQNRMASSQSQTAPREEPVATALMLAENNETAPEDYYPGVPFLSEYEATDDTHMPRFTVVPLPGKSRDLPMVDFVSTHKPQYMPSHRYEGFPSFSRMHPFAAIEADLYITIHSSANHSQRAIIKELVQSPQWQARIHDNSTLLLSVPVENFDQLRKLCCPETTTFTPEYARTSIYFSPKRFLTVAVKLD